jgi:drug/metabolite transporter (DMT)-like permease
LGATGVGLIVQLGPIQATPAVLLGTVAAILGALCFGLSAPMMKRASRRMEPLAIAGAVHAFGLVWILPAGLWELPQARFTPTAMLIIASLGVFTSSLAFWIQLRILRHISPVASMSPMFFVPMFGVAWGHLFLGEELGTGIYLGGALVLLAAALVTGFNPRRFVARQIRRSP